MKKRMKLVMPTKEQSKWQKKIHTFIKKLWYRFTGYTYFGNYYGTSKHIHFGDGVAVAPNAVLVAANPDIYDVWARKDPEDIYIGDFSYIGSGAVILPGVRLGQHTVVAANSVVKDSFPFGFCVVAGNPAKIVKVLDREKCAEYNRRKPYKKEKGLE